MPIRASAPEGRRSRGVPVPFRFHRPPLVEAKAAASVSATNFKGLHRLREQCGTDFLSGIFLYDGHTALSFGAGLWAVAVSGL